jgi:hypothetical protein
MTETQLRAYCADYGAQIQVRYRADDKRDYELRRFSQLPPERQEEYIRYWLRIGIAPTRLLFPAEESRP